MNIDLLERTKIAIMNAHEFSMGTWCECIGHHLCNIASKHVAPSHGSTLPAVCELLGIDVEAARRLCYISNWPSSFGGHAWPAWADLPNILRDRTNACRRIDYFILTNGTDVEPIPEPAVGVFEEEQELVGV